MPHAGAGASAFAQWPQLLPSDVEAVAIQLPGREDRIRETPFTQVSPLVRALVQVIRPYLTLPVAFFGHSSGGVLAFELATAMRRRLRVEPAHLFISGYPAPDAARPEQSHKLPDDEFAQHIAGLGGMPGELLADKSALRLLLPTVRAELEMWETHQVSRSAPLTSPITVFGGEHDPRVTADELAGWRSRTAGRFRLRLFDGNHFFMRAHRDELMAEIISDLRTIR